MNHPAWRRFSEANDEITRLVSSIIDRCDFSCRPAWVQEGLLECVSTAVVETIGRSLFFLYGRHRHRMEEKDLLEWLTVGNLKVLEAQVLAHEGNRAVKEHLKLLFSLLPLREKNSDIAQAALFALRNAITSDSIGK